MYIFNESETKELCFESVSELLDFLSFCCNDFPENVFWKSKSICSSQRIPGEQVPLPSEIKLDDWLEEKEDV